jgi:predicted RNase H-like nuclease (RuvC/YqgF family)
MLVFTPLPRYLPRTPQETAALRRAAELKATVTELNSHITKLEREQQIQLQRIAQLQQELDEVKRILKTLI